MISKKTLTIIALVVAAALLIAVVAVVATDIMQQKEYERKTRALNNELISSGLSASKIEIEREIKRLSGQTVERLPTMTFMFKTPDRLIYDTLRGAMSTFGMKGTICISPGSMPGDAGNITTVNYLSMLSEGYAAAVLYDGTSPLDEYLSSLRAATVEREIEFPSTMYVCGKADGDDFYLAEEYGDGGIPVFSSEVLSTLDEYGIECVVQETYESKLVSYTDFDNDFVYCEALGFNASGMLSRDSFLQSFTTRGALVFSVCFDYENANGGYYGEYTTEYEAIDGTTTDDFFRMLATVNDYRTTLRVLSIPEVAEYRQQLNEEINPETVARLEALRAQLEEVNLAIAAIYEKYK